MALEFIIPDWPAPNNVRALATTRVGGNSVGPYDSFNLGLHVGDGVERVATNRQRLLEHLSCPPRWLNQVHGAQCVDAAQTADGVMADASFSRSAFHACLVMTADCLPLLLCTQQGDAVAAVHAGWRGLAAGVIEAAAAKLQTPGAQLMAWLGPAIGPAAYTVGADVRAAFVAQDAAAAAHFVARGKEQFLCDLYGLARLRLANLGVASVHGGDLCTHSDPRRFYSHRRDGVTGRMATVVALAA